MQDIQEDANGDEEDEQIFVDAYSHQVEPGAVDASQTWAVGDPDAPVAPKSTLNSDAPPFVSPNLVMTADSDSSRKVAVTESGTKTIESSKLDTSMTSETTECSSVSDMSFDHTSSVVDDPRDADTPTPTPEQLAGDSSPSEPTEQVCSSSTSQPAEEKCIADKHKAEAVAKEQPHDVSTDSSNVTESSDVESVKDKDEDSQKT